MSGAPPLPGAREVAAVPSGSPAPADPRQPTRWQALRQAGRQMFGIPDFDRYLAHMQAKHPGAPLLSEREFHAMAIDRRYGAARPRCC